MALLMASSRTAKLINGRNAAGASPYFKNTFTCLLNPNKSANLVQELFLKGVKQMEITSVTLGMIFSGVAIVTLLIIIYGSRGPKDKDH
jgi:CBS domain containing-hemolysin-like protein